MGRNKKKSKAALHHESEEDASDEEEQQQALQVEQDQSRDEAEDAPNAEEPAPKKKEYRGNKLNKTQGGKGGKKNKGNGQEPNAAEEKAAADQERVNNNNEEEALLPSGGEEEALGQKLTEGMTVTRYEPVDVLYCPICTFPAEMCEFSGMYEQCRPWLLEHAKELAEAEERGRKRRVLTERERLERLVKGSGNKKGVERIVLIEVSQRKNKKMTTTVKGMDLFGLNLKDLSREWKKMFSCGAGVTTSEELKQSMIDIQGNVVEQLVEMLPGKYNIPKDAIYKMEDKKKVKCYGN
ncbi:hypothetical protein, conserved [Trypanosoma brucei gambiense DAL972]|uniref:SUI1 domain-containing protein n=1 Tax=Trypanosoma brucei gambiense (strain MHOM/CI/86/DAL972) TaxID=679716 RepID=D0A5G8_TRYB9|nr:hypothetical protein, conserved [Trypanosoma brucei gambiense DAL972]CBH16919.1 hypothetical protein, conserved [Trypanosoma brucei gambiense DAL972]|eukprot:XP_011779183.1 hypothetical protein, conserved [Trypanosoma brucei gambiense DAL972]